tara:strand:+ start:711 stop:1091 length:381 start_codon:yes stop_codon:yes gene_type:complete
MVNATFLKDKQHRWEAEGDIESILKYGRWRQQNWRDKNKKPKIEKELTKTQEISRNWYLANRERLLDKYHKEKKTDKQLSIRYKFTWIPIPLEDRDFVHNFNPDDYPGYKTALNILKKSLEEKLKN